MYRSRLAELEAERGTYATADAASDFGGRLLGQSTDHVANLDAGARRRIHNLEYFTWVEQQGNSVDELDMQWDDSGYWTGIQACLDPIDELIRAFNGRVVED